MGALSPINIGREGALALMERLSATTHFVSSAEYLCRSQDIENGSFGDWNLNRERFEFLGSHRMRLLDVVARPGVTRALHTGRLLASLALLAPTERKTRLAANAYLSLTSAALYPRHHYGTDGSDQVSFQTATAAAIARGVPTPRVQDVALWYIAMQSGLSYFISGSVKLFGPSWRSGKAVPGVMRTATYGSEFLWRAFQSRPRLAALGAHTMLLGEGLFPAVFLTRGRAAKPFIVGAVLFHLGIGTSMGLGRFVSAFGSMLPAVAYVTNNRRKSTLFPKMALASVGIALGAGAVGSLTRRRRVLTPPPRSTVVPSPGPDGFSIVVSQALRPGRPILILEHGMLSTPEHFSWIVDAVGDTASVVTYSRSGYGANIVISKRPSEALMPADLLSVIDSFKSFPSPIVIGGHSLGGYLARLAAVQRPEDVAGVVYIDSSHPAQLDRSIKQRDGAVALDNVFAGLSASMRCGLGWLVSKPSWISDLPEKVRHRVLDQYRDSRLWSAGVDEWRRAKMHFADRTHHELEPLSIPALVLSAEQTLRNDETQNGLNQDIAISHAGATQISILGATHDSILTSAPIAAVAARAIRDFLDQVRRMP